MITKTTEWEGQHVRLVKLGGLPTNGKGYHRRLGDIELVFVHQSAGNFKRGVSAAEAIAAFHTAQPKYKLDSDGNIMHRIVGGKSRPWLIGGGRGWPGCGYTFIVPGLPDVVDGKVEVYRANDDDRHSYHTGSHYNRVGVGVCFAGTFVSRHMKNAQRTRQEPVPDALMAGAELILDYLVPRYGIDPREGLKGHFDAGKPACPGDVLEAWVRQHRGERGLDLVDEHDLVVDDSAVEVRELRTVTARQRALVDLGFDLGKFGAAEDGVDGVWGEVSKGGLIAFQSVFGLVVDGRWGPRTEAAVQAALQEPPTTEGPG